MSKYILRIQIPDLLRSFFLLSATILSLSSCKPLIRSFTVTTPDGAEVRRVTGRDTLQVHYDVRGNATLLVYNSKDGSDSAEMKNLRLVVQKGGKEVNRSVQLKVVAEQSSTVIAFNTTALRGDTLFAEGEKNAGVWGNGFQVTSITNTSGRMLVIGHGGKTAVLTSNGTSAAFAGTSVQGFWQLKTIVTPAEKANPASLPEQLQITASITEKN